MQEGTRNPGGYPWGDTTQLDNLVCGDTQDGPARGCLVPLSSSWPLRAPLSSEPGTQLIEDLSPMLAGSDEVFK